jgi:hypothetical protein
MEIEAAQRQNTQPEIELKIDQLEKMIEEIKINFASLSDSLDEFKRLTLNNIV